VHPTYAGSFRIIIVDIKIRIAEIEVMTEGVKTISTNV
jgi:hypothetical protein